MVQGCKQTRSIFVGFIYNGKDVRKSLETIPSRIKGMYFGNLKLVINEDVCDVFLYLSDEDNHVL